MGQREAINEPLASLISGLRRANEGDNLIQMIQRNAQALENMSSCLCFLQIVLSTTADNLDLMLQVIIQHISYIKRSRLSVNKSQHIDTEVGLQLSVLK
ncbi:hypothetical protein D3C78_1117710 [compost metagenome]